MGNFGPERFGWVFEDIQPTRWPIPYRGAQGFFNVPDELLGRRAHHAMTRVPYEEVLRRLAIISSRTPIERLRCWLDEQ